MNTYVMGEIAVLLAITAIAGILIGWCIKSLFSGRSERQIRASVAHDVDQAAADVDMMRSNLQSKDADLQRVTLELQQLRGRDVSLSAGNTTQVEEINDLKVELSQARKTLDRNRSEFAAFRNEKQQELQTLSNQLASFKTGGAVHDTQINQAHDSIAALRAAARENDKIIDSLRARIKEADTTVENLRSQLKQSETTTHEATMSRQQQERATSTLNAKLKELSVSLEKQKRDYNTMLETKNRDISTQMSRLEELGNVQTLFRQKEHDYEKLSTEMRETTKNAGVEINELRQKLQASEKSLADTQHGIKRLQDQVDELTRTNSTLAEQHRTEISQLQDKHRNEIIELRRVIDNSNRELQAVNSLKTQVENKNAEVVALNDMLRDVSSKRDQSVEKASLLEQQVKDATVQQQSLQKNEQQMAALASALKQREAEYAKLRSESEATEAKRATLASQVTELQSLTPKLEQASREAETLRPQLASLKNELDQKNAQIEKLRGTGENLSALQTKTADLEAGLSKRDTDLTDAQLRVKNLTASLKERDSEIRMLRKTGDENDRAQQDINRLTESLKQRDVKLNELTTQLSSVEQARKQLEVEMQRAKTEQETEQTRLRSSDEQRSVAYKKLQDEFNKISATRDDYEKRVQNLQLQLDDQQKQFDEKLKQSEQRLQELQPQIGTLQSKVSTLASEKQQLTANLSDAENHKLQLTERDAEIRRLQIELKEAGSDVGLQASLQDQTRKVDGLTAAMLERDNEISRLNKIITDNRLGSKQQTSEVNLLKEEIDAQGKLIRSLEDQAENTLQLHKKIAQQSTEIESLRADLHLARTRTQESDSAPNQGQEIAALKQRLDAYETDARAGNERNAQLQAEISRLQTTLNQRSTEQQTRSTSPAGSGARVVTTRVTTQPAKSVAADKPRVFVRPGDNPDTLPAASGNTRASGNTATSGNASVSGNAAVTSGTGTSGTSNTGTSSATAKATTAKATTTSTTTAAAASAAAAATSSSATATTAENLAGTQMPGNQSTTDSKPAQRALYTRDGYRLKRTDGSDDLALLPGFTNDLADKLRSNSVNEFEQVALWTQREISHFADRLGINATTAGALPNAAKEILAGKFRVDSHREVEKN